MSLHQAIKTNAKVVLIASSLARISGTTNAAEPVSYPDGYRHWRHVKSMTILPGHPLEDPFLGTHHIYANPAAIAGLDSGNYANGAVFVFDLLEAQSGSNAITEGPRRLVGVMQYNQQAYASTGGWGFEGFAGDSHDQRLVKDGGNGCYDCHTSQADHHYVFSRPRN